MANDGNAQACRDLELCYRYGDFFQMNIGQANEWLEKAAHLLRLVADRDDAEALYILALDEVGSGRVTDEGIRLLENAAKQGSV